MIQEAWEKKQETIRHYSVLMNAYDSLYREEQNLKIRLVLSTVPIRSSDAILDIGCGTGLLFDHTNNSIRLLVGVDSSLELLKIAKKRLNRLGKKPSISLIRSDADYLPLRRDVFDKIFAFTILQNLPDPALTIHEMIRVARTNSTIVVTGLRKCFSEEKMGKILNKAGLIFSVIDNARQARDLITICKKAKNK